MDQLAHEAKRDVADAEQVAKGAAFGPVVKGLFDSHQRETPFLKVGDRPQAVAVRRWLAGTVVSWDGG